MGFCLFGSVAIAAMHALERRGLARVAIVDFDVHHGNGTQDLVWNEPRVLFASTHQMPLYPGTGDVHETGAHGNVLNVPLAPATGGAEMRAVYDTMILPAIADFEPDLILVSAGFDAHAADPLANLRWTEEDYRWLTHRLCDLAQDCCAGRLVSCLEGGYDLDALAASVAAHVAVLMGRGP
jgi:acetoin utilization deacetylase AcuC-like enzyme